MFCYLVSLIIQSKETNMRNSRLAKHICISLMGRRGVWRFEKYGPVTVAAQEPIRHTFSPFTADLITRQTLPSCFDSWEKSEIHLVHHVFPKRAVYNSFDPSLTPSLLMVCTYLRMLPSFENTHLYC